MMDGPYLCKNFQLSLIKNTAMRVMSSLHLKYTV